jgi:class 3 adenylate cyclase
MSLARTLPRVRLRRKLTVAFFLVSSVVSVMIAVFLYGFIETQLTDEVKDRVKDITHIGAHTVDVAAYKRLVAQLGNLDDAQVSNIEHSADYKALSDQLQMMRASEPSLIHFAYILAPTDDPKNPKFVVDADVLGYDARVARGDKLGPLDKISHFNLSYDVSSVPLLDKALADCAPQLEPDFVHDDEYEVTSVSAYVPLSNPAGDELRDAHGRCLGVLGVDITDTKMRSALLRAGGLAIKVSIVVIAIALIVSIAMGTVLTRSILSLTEIVRRFSDKDFTARTKILPRDEIGQLGANFNQMAQTIQVHSENLEDLVDQRTKELVEEKQTSERLLLNVLPQPIAERLKTGERVIVDRFDAVTVLFADIVGFTRLSSHTSPEKLVGMLDEVFSMFDRLAERHGLEKIKTIGDAYMVVAGVPQPVANHAAAMAEMALDMLDGIADYARRAGLELAIRIGIHSGSVVAGVIGKKKFIYDLWGDTVNTASRMESHGLPNRVQMTEITAHALAGQFDVEEREPIDVKGKGMMKTYWLIGRARQPDPSTVSTAEG